MNTFQIIEKNIKQLDNIKEWNTKVNHIKDIKDNIDEEINNLNELLDIVINDKIEQPKKKYAGKKKNIDELLEEFNNAELNNKINLYQLIQLEIEKINNELFM